MASAEITHKTLARLFQAIDTSETEVCRQDLLAIVEHEPFKSIYQHLEHLAEEAGTPRHWQGWELEAVLVHETFDLLLTTESWEDPGVVDPKNEGLMNPAALLNVCNARIKAGQGDLRRLLEIEKKLVVAAEKERATEERLEKANTELRETLARLLQPATDPTESPQLVQLLELLASQLRSLPRSTAAAG